MADKRISGEEALRLIASYRHLPGCMDHGLMRGSTYFDICDCAHVAARQALLEHFDPEGTSEFTLGKDGPTIELEEDEGYMTKRGTDG